MLRKLLLLLFVLVFAPELWATTPVTGNIKTLGTGNVTTGAYVRFWLRGCGGNQPRVNGTGIIGPTAGGVYYFDMVANASGAISGTLYSTRDSTGLLAGEIDCGGSKLSVWYGMQAFQNGRGGPEIPIHAQNGVTLDISTVIPLTQTPAPGAPGIPSTCTGLVAGDLIQATGPTGCTNSAIPAANVAQNNIDNNFSVGQTIGGNANIKGPSPWTDVTAYGVRAIDYNSGYTTTCTVSASASALTCAAAAQFHNADGLSLYGAGATNTLSTPSAPTVTAGLSTDVTGVPTSTSTVASSHSSCSNTESYELVAEGSWSATAANNLWGAQTAASAATTITNSCSPGPNTQTITSLSEVNGVTTVVCASTCQMEIGALVGISGTTNDTFFNGFWKVATQASGTQFTLYFAARSTSATITATGGTLGWFEANHIVTPSLQSHQFFYSIYRQDNGAGAYNFVGHTIPGSLYYDDYGSTMAANPIRYGWEPATAPGVATNGVFTTTVSAGGTTTSLTVADTSTNAVTSGFATFDITPLFHTASIASTAAASTLYLPPTVINGRQYYVVGSYLQMQSFGNTATQIHQEGGIWADDPIEVDSAASWQGYDSGNRLGAPQQISSTAVVNCNTAWPCIYGNAADSVNINNIQLELSPNFSNNALLAYMNAGGLHVWSHSYFATGGGNSNNDYMGIAVINNANGFTRWDEDTWNGGPTEAANLTRTPLLVFQGNGGNNVLESPQFNRRGIAGVAQAQLRMDDPSWLQGPIEPLYSTDNANASIGGIVINAPLMDTSGQPILGVFPPSGQILRGTVKITSPIVNAPGSAITGNGVANLIIEDDGVGSQGQNHDYANNTAAQLQTVASGPGSTFSGHVTEQSGPNYQAQPNPGNYFIEQIPGVPSSSGSAGGSLTGTQAYGVVARFPNGTSRTGPTGNTVTLGANGTITSTFAAVPGATSYDVWRTAGTAGGLPTACANITVLTCNDTGGGVSAGGGQPTAPTDGFPSIEPTQLNTPLLETAQYTTATNCAGVGTAASPSVASCGSAAAGHFSCATNATGATCQVNTTAVTANSEIFVFESDTAVTGTALGVTCNTSTTDIPTSRILASSVAATSFTINLGTVTTNPACFSYWIIN